MRRFLARQLTRFTFWLDMTAAIELPEYIHRLAAAIDDFTARYLWNVDKTTSIDEWINGGDMRSDISFGDWQVGRPQDMPKPIPFTPEELYRAVEEVEQQQRTLDEIGQRFWDGVQKAHGKDPQ